MRCPACQAENRADRRFRTDCGAALDIHPRGRALTATGRGGFDETTWQELERLRDEAHRLDYHMALPGIEQALGSST